MTVVCWYVGLWILLYAPLEGVNGLYKQTFCIWIEITSLSHTVCTATGYWAYGDLKQLDALEKKRRKEKETASAASCHCEGD